MTKVYCNQTDCVYNDGEACMENKITIDKYGNCRDYEIDDEKTEDEN